MKIENFPEELKYLIFDKLNAKNLFRLSLVCRAFSAAIQNYAPEGPLAKRWQDNFHFSKPQCTVIDVTLDPPYALVQTASRKLVSAHRDREPTEKPQRRLQLLRPDGNHTVIVGKKAPAPAASGHREIRDHMGKVTGISTLESSFAVGTDTLPVCSVYRSGRVALGAQERRDTIWLVKKLLAHGLLRAPATKEHSEEETTTLHRESADPRVVVPLWELNSTCSRGVVPSPGSAS